MPLKPNSINGGFYDYKDEDGRQYPSVVIAVANLPAAMAAVEAAGGKVVAGPDDIPGIGTFASIVDTEGNRVGMLQPARGM
jgi:predicted enzyme related to lactoylglutathione lyase